MSHLYAQYIHRYGSEIRGTIHAQELKQLIHPNFLESQPVHAIWPALVSLVAPQWCTEENLDDKTLAQPTQL